MTTTTTQTRYAIVTFGPSPHYRVFRDPCRAIRAAYRHAEESSACAIRVLDCDSPKLARTSDISMIRDGERVIATIR